MRVIDSHTEGEPTRLIVEGGPDLGAGSMAERRDRFARDFDHCRRFAVNEPRGHSAIVGALLCPPVDQANAAGLIFFNNAGYLGMCGHGAIGAAVTLAYMGRIAPGRHNFETPVGTVSVELHDRNRATVKNVASYRWLKNVTVRVDGLGEVSGDVAFGGNWFFLTQSAPCALTPANIPQLSKSAETIRAALKAQGVSGADGAEIDHIEFFGPALAKDADSRNFVLCSGGAHDRSPCGTGTSAKLACLAAEGKLAPEAEWIQESIIGSRFSARYQRDADGNIVPFITGRAFIVAEARLVGDSADPFADGI